VNHLERIVTQPRAEVERRKGAGSPPARPHQTRPFAAALRRPGLSLIAEHKRRSPSAGTIRADLALGEVIGAYQRGGAAAVSVLTEGPNFGGSLQDLAAARAASTLPVLRKDFIVDPYQLLEAVHWRADAILLIVAALSSGELRGLHEQASELGLAALVEVHDQRELEAAVEVGAELIGINNRDLTTLEVDTTRTFALRAHVPDGVLVVAESGFRTPEELLELAAAGIDAVLIGEALMRSDDIESACRALTAPTMLA
jgi:indole-3-glycerol phosphate synthase